MKHNDNDIILIKDNIDEESHIEENIPFNKVKNPTFRRHTHGSVNNSSNQDKR